MAINRATSTSYESMSGTLTALEKRLRDSGIRVSDTSRVASYRKALDRFLEAVSREPSCPPSDLRLLHQAVHEADQFALIVNEFCRPSIVAKWKPKLQELVSGHDLPETESDNTPGRDLQFELYVAALCSAGGYHVEPKEPDAVIESDGNVVSIASKRPKSLAKLERHVRKACKQIAAVGHDGVIAMDLSLIHHPAQHSLVVRTAAEAMGEVQRVANSFVDVSKVRLHALADEALVFGFLLLVSVPYFVEEHSQLSTATLLTILQLRDPPDDRRKQLQVLAERCENVLHALADGSQRCLTTG